MVEWHKVPEGEATLAELTSLAGLVVRGEDVRATLEEVATATTLTENHYLVLVSAGATITLPKAVNHKERVYTIKNIGTGSVTIDAYSNEKIDGEGTLTLSHQYSYVTIVSDGDEWFIIGGRNVKLEQITQDLLDAQKATKALMAKAVWYLGNLDKRDSDSSVGDIDAEEMEKEIQKLEAEVLAWYES